MFLGNQLEAMHQFLLTWYTIILAMMQNEFPGESLSQFAEHTYSALSNFETILPQRFSKILPLYDQPELALQLPL